MDQDKDALRAACLQMNEADREAFRAACRRLRDALARDEEYAAEDVQLVFTLLSNVIETVAAEVEKFLRRVDRGHDYDGASTARH